MSDQKKLKTGPAVTNNLEYVIIKTADVQKSIDFYVSLFGYEKAHAQEGWTELKLKSGRNSSVLAFQPAKAGTKGRRVVGPGFFTDNLDAFHAKAVAKGVPVSQPPKKQPWGGAQATYTDPNGIELSVTEFKADGAVSINLEYAIVFTNEAKAAKQLYENLYGFREPVHHDDMWLELKLDNDRRHSTLAVHQGGVPAGAETGVAGGAGEVQLGFFVKKMDEFHAKAVAEKLTVIEPPAKQPWGGVKGLYEDRFGVVHSVVECDWTVFDPHAEPTSAGAKAEEDGGSPQIAHLSGHVEIPVRNLERAKKFYGDTFGFSFQDAFPTYAIFRAPKGDPKQQGHPMGGGLDVVDSDDLLLKYHALCFVTQDIEAALDKVVANGGKVIKPKWLISEHVGWQAVWQDTEGNQHSFYKGAH